MLFILFKNPVRTSSSSLLHIFSSYHGLVTHFTLYALPSFLNLTHHSSLECLLHAGFIPSIAIQYGGQWPEGRRWTGARLNSFSPVDKHPVIAGTPQKQNGGGGWVLHRYKTIHSLFSNSRTSPWLYMYRKAAWRSKREGVSPLSKWCQLLISLLPRIHLG